MTLVFEDVEKRYLDGTPALAGVSFAIPRGQFCVVLGSSGAGKSTLLRCVNGLVAPSAGRVLIDGVCVDPRSLPRLRPRIGMIHQAFNLTGRSSVATNVICGALPACSTIGTFAGIFPRKYREQACALVAGVGLGEDHLRRRVADLSGGQQQRVGIARAFMLDPDIVLADEPVASLDPRTSEDILNLLARQAKASNATVLCSLHQIDLAMTFADRIVALKFGRLVFDGTPGELTLQCLGEIYGARTEPGDATLSAEVRA